MMSISQQGWFNDIRKYALFRALIKRFALPVMVLRMIDIGLSVEQIAMIGAVSTVLGLVLEVPSGAVADQLGHRRTLMLSMVGQAVSMACYLGGSFWWMLAGSGLYFAAGSLMTGTAQALFFERLDELGMTDSYKRLNGKTMAFANAVGVIMLPIASLLYTVAFWIPFLIGVAQFIGAGITIYFFGDRTHRYTPAETNHRAQGVWYSYRHLPVAIGVLRGNSLLFTLTLISAMLLGLNISAHEFHQVLLNNVSLAAALFGFVYALKRLLTMLLSNWIHMVMDKLSFVGVVGTAILFQLLQLFWVPFADTQWTMILAILSSTVTYTLLTVAGGSYSNMLIPTGSRATVLSVTNLIRGLVTVAGTAFMGWLAHFKDIEQVFLYVGVILALLMLVLFPICVREYSRYKQEEGAL